MSKKPVLSVSINPDYDNLRNVIAQAKGRATVVYRKKDGSLRRLTFQRGNDGAYVTGTERGEQWAATMDARHPNLIRLRDQIIAAKAGQAKSWRTVDLDTIETIRANGVNMRVA